MDNDPQNVSEQNAALALIALRQGLAYQANVVNPAELNIASDSNDSNVSIDIGFPIAGTSTWSTT